MDALDILHKILQLFECIAAMFMIALYPVVHRHFNRTRYAGAKYWVDTTATVLYSYVLEIHNSHNLRATICYGYVAGHYRRTGEYSRLFPTLEAANEFLGVMRNRQLQARYDPRNPDTSALNDAQIQSIVDDAAREGHLLEVA